MIRSKQIKSEPQSCEAVTVSPSGVANKGSWYTKLISGVVEFFYTNDAGVHVQLTNNGSVNLPAIPSLVPAGGSMSQVLAKSSNDDHAMGWRSVESLIKEFYFVLPAGADIVTRIANAGSISGLSLVTAQSDSEATAEFGASTKTLVVKPTGLSNIVVTDVTVIELVTTGPDTDKGWKKMTTFGEWKGNVAKTKACIVDFQDYIDASRQVLVKVRFVGV